MATSYPSALDSYTTLVDNSDDVLAADSNDRSDAIEALEIKLGVNSSAVATSIDYFLKHASGAYRIHQHDGSSDDGAKLDWDNCWTDAVHNHSSAGEGDTVPIVGGGTGVTTAQAAINALAGAVTANRVLKGNGSNIVLGQVVLTTDVTGILPEINLPSIISADYVNTSALYGTAYLPDATVDYTALKTGIGEVSGTSRGFQTLPGGTYGFGIQTKSSGAYASNIAVQGTGNADSKVLPSSYGSYADMYAASGVVYAQQRYVTASGEDLWVFLLIDKATKDIISAFVAEDHPAYGNGGDFDKVPHPFISYNANTQEIILLDKSICLALKQESEDIGKSILTLVNEEYKPDMSKEGIYRPLHSGKFIDSKGKHIKQMVETIPSYIKVRGLTKLSQAEKDNKKQKEQARGQQIEQEKIKKEQDKVSAQNKLKLLGLTTEEILAFKN